MVVDVSVVVVDDLDVVVVFDVELVVVVDVSVVVVDDLDVVVVVQTCSAVHRRPVPEPPLWVQSCSFFSS